jgi:N utilization substance protein A
LAIGKEGQNVRLAARLTGWKIDIKDSAKYDYEAENEKIAAALETRRQLYPLDEDYEEYEDEEQDASDSGYIAPVAADRPDEDQEAGAAADGSGVESDDALKRP